MWNYVYFLCSLVFILCFHDKIIISISTLYITIIANVMQYAFLEHTYSFVLPVNLCINSPKCTDFLLYIFGKGVHEIDQWKNADPEGDQKAFWSSAEGLAQAQKIQEMVQ